VGLLEFVRRKAMIDHNFMNEQRAAFVWSKLRKRFHAPGCRWALKILPENRQAGDRPTLLDGEPRSPCRVCEPSCAVAEAN
jgi:hypothetical protein